MTTDKTISRKEFLSAAVVSLAAGPLLFSDWAFASGVEFDSPSKEEIASKLIEIGMRYEEGESLSDEDAAFVARYAQSNQRTRATPIDRTFEQDVNGYGTTIHVAGRVWHSGTINYEYGGRMIAQKKSGGTPKKMTLGVEVNAWGAGADGGLFVVHSGSVSHSAGNTTYLSMDKSRAYSGLVVYYSMSPYIDVTTSSGSAFRKLLG